MARRVLAPEPHKRTSARPIFTHEVFAIGIKDLSHLTTASLIYAFSSPDIHYCTLTSTNPTQLSLTVVSQTAMKLSVIAPRKNHVLDRRRTTLRHRLGIELRWDEMLRERMRRKICTTLQARQHCISVQRLEQLGSGYGIDCDVFQREGQQEIPVQHNRPLPTEIVVSECCDAPVPTVQDIKEKINAYESTWSTILASRPDRCRNRIIPHFRYVDVPWPLLFIPDDASNITIHALLDFISHPSRFNEDIAQKMLQMPRVREEDSTVRRRILLECLEEELKRWQANVVREYLILRVHWVERQKVWEWAEKVETGLLELVSIMKSTQV